MDKKQEFVEKAKAIFGDLYNYDQFVYKTCQMFRKEHNPSANHRFNFIKTKIVELVENGHNKTEKQIMDELGYDRLWDCGSYKFIWS
jgi:hypothetical protein